MALYAEYGFNNVATDSSGNARNLTAGTYTTGKNGQAAGSEFTGLVVGTALPAWTVMGWVNLATAPSDWAAVFTEGNNLYFEISSGRQLSIYVSGTTLNSGATVIATATDVHIAVRGGNTGGLALVINGTQVAATPGAVAALPAGTYSVGGGGGDAAFNLHLDDFRVYDTALNDAAIAAAALVPAGGASGSTVTLTPATVTPSARPLVPQSAVVLSRPTVTLSAVTVSPAAGGSAVTLTPATVTLSARPVTPQSAVVLGRPTVTLTPQPLTPGPIGKTLTPVTVSFSPVALSATSPDALRYIAGVSGGHFVDQNGDPILVKGDSPWSAFTELLEADWAAWCADRESKGFNAAIVSLIGTPDNGSESADTNRYGEEPWSTFPALSTAYFNRIDTFLEEAADHGITVFLYAVDGWAGYQTPEIAGASAANLATWGTNVANRLKHHPNIVWMVGGDYNPVSLPDIQSRVFDAVVAADDRGTAGVQLSHQVSWSTDFAGWASRADWNFVYTRFTPHASLRGARASSSVPALFSEGYYEREASAESAYGTAAPVSAYIARLQCADALCGGSPGDFYGSHYWRFGFSGSFDIWKADTLGTGGGVLQGQLGVSHIRSVFEQYDWHTMQPDFSNTVVTGGRGTALTGTDATNADAAWNNSRQYLLEPNYVGCLVAPDKSAAIIYNPDSSVRSSVTISAAGVGSSPTLKRIDPSTGAETSMTWTTTLTNPGANAAGYNDWLYVIEAVPVSASAVTLTPQVLTLTARPLAPAAGSTVTLTPRAITLTAQAVTPTLQPVQLTLTPAVVTVTPTTLAPGGVMTVTLTPASISLSAVSVSATPGSVSVTLTTASVSLAALPVAPESQAPGVTLTAVTVTLTARPLSAAPGVVGMTLTPATVTITARAVSAGGPVGPIITRNVTITLREDNYRVRLR